MPSRRSRISWIFLEDPVLAPGEMDMCFLELPSADGATDAPAELLSVECVFHVVRAARNALVGAFALFFGAAAAAAGAPLIWCARTFDRPARRWWESAPFSTGILATRAPYPPTVLGTPRRPLAQKILVALAAINLLKSRHINN